MAGWAHGHSDVPTMRMNDTVVAPYMDSMCALGYDGPLCGSCSVDYGRAGTACVRCPPRGVNSFLYFLVCIFMLVSPVVQMLLHSTTVRARKVSTNTAGLSNQGSQQGQPSQCNQSEPLRTGVGSLFGRWLSVEPLDEGVCSAVPVQTHLLVVCWR
jgi:hypothetical protein